MTKEGGKWRMCDEHETHAKTLAFYNIQTVVVQVVVVLLNRVLIVVFLSISILYKCLSMGVDHKKISHM